MFTRTTGRGRRTGILGLIAAQLRPRRLLPSEPGGVIIDGLPRYPADAYVELAEPDAPSRVSWRRVAANFAAGFALFACVALACAELLRDLIANMPPQ